MSREDAVIEVECDVRDCRAEATAMCLACAGWFCPAHITASALGQPVCAECWALVPLPLHELNHGASHVEEAQP